MYYIPILVFILELKKYRVTKK